MPGGAEIRSEKLVEHLSFLQKAALFGQKLYTRAGFWAVDQIAVEPNSTRVRIDVANVAQNLAEYGNQVTARADTLLWQVRKTKADLVNFPRGAGNTASKNGVNAHGTPGIDIAKRLALSLYLRDSAPTDFLNLYEWNRAAVGGDGSSPSGFTQVDRTRLVERLVSDTYWSKVNTVYGSGQGDVSMALIKDDIGNWNLKNFGNDPTKLLEAYSDFARSAVTAAIGAATGPPGVGGASRLLSLATRVTTGEQPAETAFG